MGEGVIYKIVKEVPLTINNRSITVMGRNYELLRTYVNRGIRHFVAESLFGNNKIDFIVKGKNALICEH